MKLVSYNERRRAYMKFLGLGLAVVGLAGLVWAWLIWLGDAAEPNKVQLPGSDVRSQAPESSEEPVDEGTLPRLEIAGLDVAARIEEVGQDESGNMREPSASDVVAIYNGNPSPGESGNSVLAGHVDTRSDFQGGIFGRLDEIAVGDGVDYYVDENTQYTYRVISREVYPYDDAPNSQIFSDDGEERLTLITCSGRWEDEAQTYDQRLVVVAERVN